MSEDSTQGSGNFYPILKIQIIHSFFNTVWDPGTKIANYVFSAFLLRISYLGVKTLLIQNRLI
jgi:hypothetical protein